MNKSDAEDRTEGTAYKSQTSSSEAQLMKSPLFISKFYGQITCFHYGEKAINAAGEPLLVPIFLSPHDILGPFICAEFR